MRDSIDVLLKLRQLDETMQGLRTRLGACQADLQRKRMEADLLRQALTAERERLKDAQSRRREADMEVRTFRERKLQSEKRMNEVKTNEEFQALQREIATMERKAREWEDVVLEAMEAEEAAEANVTRMEGEYQEKEKAAAGEQARFDAERQKAGGEVAELDGDRAVLVEKLTGAVRAKYERLRQAKKDAVIVSVRDGSCGGCHYNLPPQKVNEVRRGEKMVLCEGCGRILVWPAAASSEE